MSHQVRFFADINMSLSLHFVSRCPCGCGCCCFLSLLLVGEISMFRSQGKAPAVLATEIPAVYKEPLPGDMAMCQNHFGTPSVHIKIAGIDGCE